MAIRSRSAKRLAARGRACGPRKVKNFRDRYQTGRTGRRWYQRGVRPSGIRDRRHEAVYLFGAACPERDTAIGLVLPVVSTAAMQAFLDELAMHIADGAHAVVIMDRAARDGLLAIAPPVMDWPPAGAGWHCAIDLAVPDNITPVFLPPYSPELNAIERLWLYIKERFLSHRLWNTYDDIIDTVCNAWNSVRNEPGRIRSLCSLDWAKSVSH
ncbi:MAG: transposase [Geminicoccaceae bacterium]